MKKDMDNSMKFGKTKETRRFNIYSRASTRERSVIPLGFSDPLNSSWSSKISPKLKLPTFSGDRKEKPTKFIKALKKYVTATNVNYEQISYVIIQALSGNASIWFDAVESGITCFDDFEKEFRSCFWGTEVQADWARKVEYGHFDPSLRNNPLDYAARMWSFAQELDRGYSEVELVTKIGDHFDWNIRYAVRSHNITTQNKLFELLEFKDRDKISKKSENSCLRNLNNQQRQGMRINRTQKIPHRGPQKHGHSSSSKIIHPDRNKDINKRRETLRKRKIYHHEQVLVPTNHT